MVIFKAAVVQIRYGKDPACNVLDCEALVHDAAGLGKAYVNMLKTIGAIVGNKDASEVVCTTKDKDLVVASGRKLAAEIGIHLYVYSTAIVRADCKLANRDFLFWPDGATLTTYDKIYILDVDILDVDLDNGESWLKSPAYEKGKEYVVADTSLTKLGFAIYYDLCFLQPCSAKALAGAEVLTMPVVLIWQQIILVHWHVLLRSYAIEKGAFVIASTHGNKQENGRETFGHSLIINPWSRMIVEVVHDAHGVIIVVIDTQHSVDTRKKIYVLKHASEFVVSLRVAEGGALRGVTS